MEFEELRKFSHQIARDIINGKITQDEAVAQITEKMNCNPRYANGLLMRWVLNEPTYNGMTMTSSRQIKSGVDYSDKLKEFEKRYSKIKGNSDKEEDLIQYYVGRYNIPEEILDEIAFNLRINSSRRPVKSSRYYIEYYAGGTDNGYVSYDNNATIDLDNAMIFDSEQEANEWKDEHDNEWGATLKVVPYPDYDEIESSRKITSARYIATDPESGEVLGSADTYEEALDEWGEDVTITDSEAAEGQEDMEGGLFSGRQITSGINDECIGTSKDGRYSVYKNDADKVYMFAEDGYFTKEVDYDDPEVEGVLENWKEIYDIPLKSSKKPETTKQFVTRILSELETGEITEDEAAEEIAEANDVNIGYARQILSSYIADKDRYITSGMLELGDALNVEFDPDGNLDSWSVDFATDPEKPAPTLGGELVRAARHIISAFRDNDEKVGWGYAREVLNPAARFIVENTEYKQNDVFEDLLDGQTYNDDAYRQFIDMFETDFADYLRDHEELFHKLNKKSFEENANDEDEYSSIDYFSVNNEHVDYWFRYEDGQYVCDNVDPVVNQEWNEGDIITAEDFPFDNIDFNEEYGIFDYDDGFIYSWEDGDGESVRISNVEYKYSEFEEGDVLTPDELENLAENGYEFHDTNGNEIRISDIM